MNESRIEAALQKLDERVDRIEQILPTLATKSDLMGFPTKDDPKGFATKDDLKVFATKDDLKAFATKDDLKQGLASTLAESKLYTRVLFEDLKSDIGLLAEHLAHVSEVVDEIARRR